MRSSVMSTGKICSWFATEESYITTLKKVNLPAIKKNKYIDIPFSSKLLTDKNRISGGDRLLVKLDGINVKSYTNEDGDILGDAAKYDFESCLAD